MGLPGAQGHARQAGPDIDLAPRQRGGLAVAGLARGAEVMEGVEPGAQRLGGLGGVERLGALPAGLPGAEQVRAQGRAGLQGQVEAELGAGVLEELLFEGPMNFPSAAASSLTCTASQGCWV